MVVRRATYQAIVLLNRYRKSWRVGSTPYRESSVRNATSSSVPIRWSSMKSISSSGSSPRAYANASAVKTGPSRAAAASTARRRSSGSGAARASSRPVGVYAHAGVSGVATTNPPSRQSANSRPAQPG
jgi:hypothetical protein